MIGFKLFIEISISLRMRIMLVFAEEMYSIILLLRASEITVEDFSTLQAYILLLSSELLA